MRSPSRLIGLIATLVAPALLSAQTYPKAADPRSTLKPGRYDAGTAAKNMRLVSFSKKPAQFDTVRGLTFINSDLAFGSHYAYQGNFAGFTIWDVSNPAKPVVMSAVDCITSQGDPTIVGNLRAGSPHCFTVGTLLAFNPKPQYAMAHPVCTR